MTAEYTSNGFHTELAGNGGPVSSGATSFNVLSSTGCPATPFRAAIGPPGADASEIVLVTTVASLAWTVTRGIEAVPGTGAGSGVAHNDGDVVAAVITAAGVANVLTPVFSTASVEAWDHIANHPDGAITGLVPGGSRTGAWLPGPASNPVIVSGGKLTIANASDPAGYPEIRLLNPCNRIGARWTYGIASVPNNGSITLAAWHVDIATTFGTSIPDTPIHLSMWPGGWQCSYWLGNSIFEIQAGTFSPPLIADGATTYTADVFLDRANSQATLYLPDGTVVVVADPHIGSIVGYFATWEIYTSASTGSLVGVEDCWADSLSQAPLGIQPLMHAVQIGGPNLLTAEDASFEGGTTGNWSVTSNCSVANSTSFAASGTHSLKVTATAGGVGYAGPKYPLFPSTPYTFVASVLAAAAGAPAQWQILWLDSSSSFISAFTTPWITDSEYGWTQLVGSGISPSNAAFAYVLVAFTFGGASEVHYVDRVAMNQGYGTRWTPGGIPFMPPQSTTALAPAYFKGGVYYDTTLNKLRIGGAAGWETVTSA